MAASNGPRSTVLSGEPEALRRVAETISADGTFCRDLESVDFASHSPQMEPLQGELVRSLGELVPEPTAIPMISTVRGEPIDGTELGAAYWAANLREPVLFQRAMSALADSGHDVFVEISPHPMLAEATAACLASQQAPGAVVTSLRRDVPGRETLLGQLGELYCAGFPVDWRTIYGARPPMVPLPPYPWQRERYWLDDEYGRSRVESLRKAGSSRSRAANSAVRLRQLEDHADVRLPCAVSFAVLIGTSSIYESGKSGLRLMISWSRWSLSTAAGELGLVSIRPTG